MESHSPITQKTRYGNLTTIDPSVVQKDVLVRELTDDVSMMKKMTIAIYVVLILLGVGTGYVLAGARSGSSALADTDKPTFVKSDKIVGITDTKTFPDWAEGMLEKGGLDGEGTHKLIRDGGPSQTAYLLSSVVDLDEYVGKKIKVWGQTILAKKVSWLMDVGKIELK